MDRRRGPEIAAAGRATRLRSKPPCLRPRRNSIDARKKLVDAIKARHKQVTRAVKELGKLQEERDAREQEVKLAAEREIAHLREAAADLLRICSSDDEAPSLLHRRWPQRNRGKRVQPEPAAVCGYLRA